MLGLFHRSFSLAESLHSRLRPHSLPGGEQVAAFQAEAAAVGPGRSLFVAGKAGVERHRF